MLRKSAHPSVHSRPGFMPEALRQGVSFRSFSARISSTIMARFAKGEMTHPSSSDPVICPLATSFLKIADAGILRVKPAKTVLLILLMISLSV